MSEDSTIRYVPSVRKMAKATREAYKRKKAAKKKQQQLDANQLAAKLVQTTIREGEK